MEMIDEIMESLLIDYSPFFATACYKLEKIEDLSCETSWTDGTKLGYNPKYLASLPLAQSTAVLAHEAMHDVLHHPWCMAQCDDKEVANRAADFVVNWILSESGMRLPPGCLIDKKYAGMDFWQVYALLKQDKQDQGSQGQSSSQAGKSQASPGAPDNMPGGSPNPQQQNNAPNGQQGGNQQGSKQQGQTPGVAKQFGEIREPSTDPDSLTEIDWQITAEQCMAVSEKRGKMPGGLAQAVKQNRPSGADWREILRKFVQQIIPSDYSWSCPDEIFLGEGIYLPGLIKDTTPKIYIAVDTSGSCWSPEELQLAANELTGILDDCRPESLEVIFCDSVVKGQQSFSPGDTVKLGAKGGGGTAFQPVFDLVNEAACLIYLTDLDGPTPKEPPYPVLWVTSQRVRRVAPFGETIRIN